ncbi:MAG: MarR family transcriptional regulator [Crocinitomicaceae bacterium]
MHNNWITQEQLQLVEKLGVMFEGPGVQPAAARVLALLMVSDKLELTFDEIREVLNLSKSATSNALNLMVYAEKLEYITKPGDRKRYFRSRINCWHEGVSEKFKEFGELKLVMKLVLEQRTSDTPEFNKNLSSLIQLLEFLGKELPSLFEKWTAHNSPKK